MEIVLMKNIDVILHETEKIYKYGISICSSSWLRTSIFERGTQKEKRELFGCNRKITAATYIAERCFRTDEEERRIAANSSNVLTEKNN